MSLDAKTYADKGVQVNLNASSSEQHFLLQDARGVKSSDTASNTIEHSTALRFDDRTIVLDAAYTYPDQCQAQLGPSRSPPASRRICKHPQLPYSRPSQATSLEKRVVSLPDAPPMQGLFNLTVPTETLRVVSLPGTVATHRLSGSPATTDNNSSIEYLDTSADTSSYRSSRAASVHLRTRNFPPSDMPATPSPPSSPESIMIIGNDPCLPKSFLRQNSLSPASVFSTEDDAGWITWAGSPPRPIPALHGPLSLPYARCPSGAEGTIIEDADLPRMIWGLDLDDTNSNVNPARNAPNTSVAKAQPPRSNFDDTQKLSLKSAPPSQLSETLYSTGPPGRKAQEDTPLVPKAPPTNYVIDPRPQGQNSRASYRIPHRTWNEAPIQLPRPFAQATYGQGFLATHGCGTLGVDWHDLASPRSQLPSDLKPSAPTFVPKHQVASPVIGTQSRIFVEPCAGAEITPEHRLSATEIAQRYRVEQQQQTQASLPTPPSSSSPIWSPTFSTYAPPPQGLIFHCTQQPSPPEQYYTSGPTPACGRDFSEELRQINAARRELGAITGLRGIALSADNVNATSGMNDPRALRGVRRQYGLHRPSPVPIDISLILKQQSNVSRSDTSHLSTPRPNVPLAIPQPRNSLGQRPQSTPMTRLIQRRLSSVREEDVPNSSKPGGSPVHISAGMSFSSNTDLEDANVIHDSRRKSRPDGKVAAGGFNIHVEDLGTNEDDEEKENKTAKETNAGKPTTKKKWRPRKKAATAN